MKTSCQVHASEPGELASWMSARDAISLLEFTHLCVACRTRSDFLALFAKLERVLPFQNACAISGRHDATSGTITSIDCVNVSFPEEACREYGSRDYFQVDPIMRLGLTSYGVQYYSEERIERPKEITALCLEHGMRQGYILGARPSGPGEKGSLFFFKGPSMKLDGHFVRVLEFAAPHLQLALSRVLQLGGAAESVVALSDREREVLAWLHEGKSSWDMSVILGISERTVNFHVCNITRKLGATRRSQALMIAARLGLVG